jgi:hypothetical protein
MCETTDSNPFGSTKLYGQSRPGVRLFCAFYQPQHLAEKGWAKTTPHVLTFLNTIFFSWAILGTGGAAVISSAVECNISLITTVAPLPPVTPVTSSAT